VNSTHNPRLDEEMKKETASLTRGAPVEARKDELREQEAPADDEQIVAARTAHPPTLGPDEPTARTELSRHLGLSVFPARQDALLRAAQENHAPEAVLEALRRLPGDVTYHTVYEIWEALGGHVEHVSGRPGPPRKQAEAHGDV